MIKMIEQDRQGDIVVLRFCHGKASALDTEFLLEIAQVMEELEENDCKACVLTGTGNIFSAGVNLKRLMEGGPAYLEAFMPALNSAFGRLFSFEKPLIAACNGHAIAGGCVILACCDRRFVAQGKGRIGVPELRVGVPFPLLALEIMRASVPPHRLQEVIYDGVTYGVDQAKEMGLCDDIIEEDQLLEVAVNKARQLAGYPREAFAFNKRQLRRPTWHTMTTFGDADSVRALDIWQSEPVQSAIGAYVAKTLG